MITSLLFFCFGFAGGFWYCLRGAARILRSDVGGVEIHRVQQEGNHLRRAIWRVAPERFLESYEEWLKDYERRCRYERKFSEWQAEALVRGALFDEAVHDTYAKLRPEISLDPDHVDDAIRFFWRIVDYQAILMQGKMTPSWSRKIPELDSVAFENRVGIGLSDFRRLGGCVRSATFGRYGS